MEPVTEPVSEPIVNVIDSILVEVRKMMATDLLDENKKQEILNFVKNVLGMKEYIDLVNSDLNAILADKKIDQNDIPRMILVVLKLHSALPSLMKLKNQISIQTLKYLFFGTIYYYVSNKKTELFDVIKSDEFRLIFTTLWQLVEFQPPGLTEIIDKFSCCC